MNKVTFKFKKFMKKVTFKFKKLMNKVTLNFNKLDKNNTASKLLLLQTISF